MRNVVFFLIAAVLLFAGGAAAQRKYTGPRPTKPDVPFLVHAGKLVETEVGTARESQEKEGTTYTVSGASSPVRTPLSEPVMIFQADRINPDRLTLYKMDVRAGNRVVVIPTPGKRRKDARPIFLMVSPLGPGLFKVEVNEVIADGEYCLSPEGANQVFCFSAY